MSASQDLPPENQNVLPSPNTQLVQPNFQEVLTILDQQKQEITHLKYQLKIRLQNMKLYFKLFLLMFFIFGVITTLLFVAINYTVQWLLVFSVNLGLLFLMETLHYFLNFRDSDISDICLSCLFFVVGFCFILTSSISNTPGGSYQIAEHVYLGLTISGGVMVCYFFNYVLAPHCYRTFLKDTMEKINENKSLIS